MSMFDSYLRAKAGRLFAGDRSVHLKGINLGGWLMMEGYILQAPNRGVRFFERDFNRIHGTDGLEEFYRTFRENFIARGDFVRMADMGFNCVRIPFHYKQVEPDAKGAFPSEIRYLDRAVRWARESGLWVILDLHAAPGSQNQDWHSDSNGRAALWTSRYYQHRTCRIWESLAGRYKNEKAVAGYDLLNEPVTENRRAVTQVMKDLIRAVRTVDPRHLLFIEGNHWARDCDILDHVHDDNAVFHVHIYDPIEMVFNLNPRLCYPDCVRNNQSGLKKMIQSYGLIGRQREIPVLIGEFGVNYRFNERGECDWVADMTRWFNELGFNWAYWTYKAVKNSVFPDGLFSYYPNPDWVRRQGPLTGWETFAACWPGHKQAMRVSWRTESFDENIALTQVLRKALSHADHQHPESANQASS